MTEGHHAGKRVVVVYGEPDAVETAMTLLPMCEQKGAATFSEAGEILETEEFKS